MKNTFKIISSIIFGIIIGLFLTLNLLGKEWYMVIIAIIIGGTSGVTFYAPKESWQTVKNAWQLTCKKMKTLKISFEKIKHKKIDWKKTSYTTVIVILNYGSLILLSYYLAISSIENTNVNNNSNFTFTLFFFLCFYTISIMVFMINTKEYKLSRINKLFLKLKLIKIKTKIVSKEKYLTHTTNFFVWGMVWYLATLIFLGFLIFCAFCTLLVAIQAILFVVFYFTLFFQMIGRDGKKIIILTCIVTGILTGTLASFYLTGTLCFLTGILGGIIILGITFFMKQITKEIKPLNLFKTNGEYNFARKFISSIL